MTRLESFADRLARKLLDVRETGPDRLRVSVKGIIEVEVGAFVRRLYPRSEKRLDVKERG